jgi:hypothetical protein
MAGISFTHTRLSLAVMGIAVGSTWAQPPSDCQPNALNIPGAPYPCVYPDNRVMFRVAAADAQKVRVRLGPGFDMTKGPDGPAPASEYIEE